jgi:hypothetical protein
MKHRALAALTAALGTAVLVATPGLAMAATSYPNDYFFAKGDQWALTGATASIQAPAAWCRSTGVNVTVAMIDTGADFSHPELSGKLIRGVAYTGGTATTEAQTSSTPLDDQYGHGTVTTGVVVANTDNGQGVAAVAPDAKAMVMQVRGSDGSIWESDIALAIEYAADHGAKVINISIEPGQYSVSGNNVPDLTIPGAAEYAHQMGAVVVLSSGNQSQSQAVYPNLNGIALVVGALAPDGTMASYSNHGTDVSVYAPGGATLDTSQMTLQNSVVSTYLNSGYAVSGGTSLSAPMVSGTVALLMANGDSATLAMSHITNSAVTRNGRKELDAAAALGLSDSTRCGTPSTPPPGPPPPVVPGGGTQPTTTTSSTTTHRTTTTTTLRTTTTQQTQVTTSASTSTTTTTSGASSPGGVAGAGGNDAGEGGHRAALPPAVSPSGGGVPAPLVIGGLGLLLAGGAPLGARLIKAKRGRGVAR